MHFDIFSKGDSFFHTLDARIKILIFVPLVFIVALLQEMSLATIYLLLAAFFIFATRIHWKDLFSRIMVLNVFILFLWLTIPFSIEGTAIFTFNRFTFSHEGALYALIITLKANAILLFTISLIGTTEVFVLAHALFHLRCPKKLVYLAIFLYRYIGVLHEEYERLLFAVKARGFYPKTNFHTFKTYAYMVGMLFVNSYERSQRVYQALTLRGFRGDFPMLMHFQYHLRDIMFVMFMAVFIFTQFVLWK